MIVRILTDYEHGWEMHVFLFYVIVVIMRLFKLVFVDTAADKDKVKLLGLIVGPFPQVLANFVEVDKLLLPKDVWVNRLKFEDLHLGLKYVGLEAIQAAF